MNVNLGAPYEALIHKIIDRGLAGNQTEAIRQALTAYERQIEEEEAFLVHKAVEMEIDMMTSGKKKGHSFRKVMNEAGL